MTTQDTLLNDPLTVVPPNPPQAAPVDAPALWQRFPAAALEGVDTGHAMWSEVVPGGSHWSWRMPRGSAMRFVALEAGANVSLVLYSALEKLERYNMPDSAEGAAHGALHARPCAHERHGPQHGQLHGRQPGLARPAGRPAGRRADAARNTARSATSTRATPCTDRAKTAC